MNDEIVVFDNYSSEFRWDYKLHFPIPTANYILNRVGIDINSRHDTTDEANGTILAIVRTARNYAYRAKNQADIIGTNYYLAHDIDMIYKALEYIMEFINIFYTSGSYLDLLNVGQKVVIPAIDNALNDTNLLINYSRYAYYTDNTAEIY